MTELSRIHPEEPGAVALLDQAITALTTALDDMPIADVAATRAKVVTVQTATKQLGMSKQAQEYAAEAVRRSEWALGMKLREGQAEGAIAKREDNLRAGPEVPQVNVGKASPTDFGTSGEIYGRGQGKPGILDLADAFPGPEQFDAALAKAKEEGNLSRANVARKAREKGGAPQRASRRKPLPDFARDAGWDLRKAVERLERIADDDRFVGNKEQVATHLRSHLTNAVEVCQDLLDRINNN